MHLERFPEHTRRQPGDEVRQLMALLGGYRWRLGGERLLRLLVRGGVVAGVLIALASALSWLLDLSAPPVVFWSLLLVPLLAALIVGGVSWPSHAQTARAADRRLGLEERAATAVELSRSRRPRPAGRFDALQVHDAVERLRDAPQAWRSTGGPRRAELALLLAAAALAAASLLLPRLPRPSFESAAEPPVVDAGTGSDERTIPPDDLDLRLSAPTAPEQEQPPDADLAPRVRAAQAEQQSLDSLAQALSDVSATRSAADAIQQGDFTSARDQLSSLGEEADQLSDAAKKQLARALSDAANGASGDPQLAERERQAAQALARNNYAEQRQALKQLADQVARSGSRSMPQSQMARDVGQLQQQAAGGQQAPTGGAPSSGVQAQPAQQAQQGAGGAVPSSSTGQTAGGGGGAADQGGPGAGSGSSDGVGDPSSRLATSGQKVEVPTKLSDGQAQRPATGNEDQVGSNPSVGGGNVAEAAQTQQTGQLTPEQNLVPSEQRPVVRGYFR
jgi:hypothetical protein